MGIHALNDWAKYRISAQALRMMSCGLQKLKSKTHLMRGLIIVTFNSLTILSHNKIYILAINETASVRIKLLNFTEVRKVSRRYTR